MTDQYINNLIWVQTLVNRINERNQPWAVLNESLIHRQTTIVSALSRLDRETIEILARVSFDGEEVSSLPDDKTDLANSIFERFKSNTINEFRGLGPISAFFLFCALFSLFEEPDYTDNDRERDQISSQTLGIILEAMKAETNRVVSLKKLPRAVVKSKWANVRKEPNGNSDLLWRLAENEGVFIETRTPR